jgi:hypothetical protein
VSLDFGAPIRQPVTLAELVTGAARVQAELLGLPAVPPLGLVAGRRRDWGQIADPGRLLGDDELRTLRIGPGVPDPGAEVVGPDGGRLVTLLQTPPGGSGLLLVPLRRAYPVHTALSLALAAAIAGGVELVDNDLQLAHAAGVDDGDPAVFLAATRLEPRAGTVDEAVAAYLGRFEHLSGWSLI